MRSRAKWSKQSGKKSKPGHVTAGMRPLAHLFRFWVDQFPSYDSSPAENNSQILQKTRLKDILLDLNGQGSSTGICESASRNGEESFPLRECACKNGQCSVLVRVVSCRRLAWNHHPKTTLMRTANTYSLILENFIAFLRLSSKIRPKHVDMQINERNRRILRRQCNNRNPRDHASKRVQ